FPEEIRALGRRCPFYRYDARSGGGYWPDRDEIWLAAGVETYEGLRQVRLSACHELFHFVCWNHPRYRADEDRGFARLRRVIAESKRMARDHSRYHKWVTGSFLRQGDHANIVEYFADIPTNFRDPAEVLRSAWMIAAVRPSARASASRRATSAVYRPLPRCSSSVAAPPSRTVGESGRYTRNPHAAGASPST